MLVSLHRRLMLHTSQPTAKSATSRGLGECHDHIGSTDAAGHVAERDLLHPIPGSQAARLVPDAVRLTTAGVDHTAAVAADIVLSDPSLPPVVMPRSCHVSPLDI